ncbi:MAG: RNA polymerase sigma factor [Planctomycetota bacterium]|nr:RNA polymerase sigma factor [Planctomycetota bacterium]MED5507261.1 RNA polymerase sigma factor [Planctomycetota bacterium]
MSAVAHHAHPLHRFLAGPGRRGSSGQEAASSVILGAEAASKTESGRVDQSSMQETGLLAERTDEQLLAAHIDGEAGAFPELLERYRNELLHFLIRFLGSRAAAEDVFQDTFLQIHLVAETFDPSRRFKPWLYTISANKARDYHRKQKRRAAASLSAPIGGDGEDTEFIDLIASETDSPETPITDQEQAQRVKQVVDDLPPHYREILLLNYFQKLSYNQIADSLDIPLGTVKSRLHSAVACFADTWKLHENDEKETEQTP